MKSIKEKSNEYATEFVEPFVLYYTKDEVRQFKAQHEDSFEAGANYVLDIIEQALTPQKCLTDIGIDVSPEALIKTALQTIEALKKK